MPRGIQTNLGSTCAANQKISIRFLAGDFNMALTEVPKQLRSRGIKCDCVAWYLWKGDCAQTCTDADIDALSRRQPLGFDSCGIFYIGGTVEVITEWGLQPIDILAAVAGDRSLGWLLEYHGTNAPGQPWVCYRSKKHDEKARDKNLTERLNDLLTPSTNKQELDRTPS